MGVTNMPYGYANYLEHEKKRSIATIDEHVRQINYFFNFLNLLYKKPKELHEISSKDIRDYLESKKAKMYVPKTINKILAILKSFFDYLWQKSLIAIDPAVKIKYEPLKPKNSPVTYEQLLKILPDVLNSRTYNIQRQVIYLLVLKGFRLTDFHFLKDDVHFINGAVIITLRTQGDVEGHNKRTVTLMGLEADIFTQYYNENILSPSDYLFTSDKQGHNELTPIEKMTIYQNIRTIAKHFNLGKFNLSDIRYAYIYYLNTKAKMSIRNIADHFGISETSAANIIRRVKERMTNNNLIVAQIQ